LQAQCRAENPGATAAMDEIARATSDHALEAQLGERTRHRNHQTG
jgi:hypothetical protein